MRPLEETAEVAAIMVEHHRAPAFINVVIEQGWADQQLLDSMYAEVQNWGERDDAFFSYTFGECIAWKPYGPSHSAGC